MTRAEAKDILYEWQEMMVRNGVPLDTSKVQALRVAIEALQGDMYCPNCGVRLVPENECLEPTPTHGRLIDADALSKKLCGTTIFIKDGEVFQRMINDAPTVQADRPYGKWTPVTEQLPKIDETLHLCDQISDEVLGTDTYGNIRHVYLTNCGYLKPTFCTVEEGMSVDIVAWMPTPEPHEEVIDGKTKTSV